MLNKLEEIKEIVVRHFFINFISAHTTHNILLTQATIYHLKHSHCANKKGVSSLSSRSLGKLPYDTLSLNSRKPQHSRFFPIRLTRLGFSATLSGRHRKLSLTFSHA